MVLVHDIVEIDAGDTYCYDEAGNATKAEREKRAADRIFALLPEGQRAEYYGLWEEFERQNTAEARFAAVMDRIQPLLLNLSRNGLSWQEHGIHLSQVQKRNEHVAEGSKELSDHIFALLDDANKRGILPD